MKKLRPWSELPNGELPEKFRRCPWYTQKWWNSFFENAPSFLVEFNKAQQPIPAHKRTPIPPDVQTAWSDYVKVNPIPTVQDWVDWQKKNTIPRREIPRAIAESQEKAMHKLMLKALGYRVNEHGGASIGETPIDAEQMFLHQVEAAGSVSEVRGLFAHISGLWRADSPYRSKDKLDKFLIRIGRALSSGKSGIKIPDWERNVGKLERYVAAGWCEVSWIEGERWPPLCFLTSEVLCKLLSLSKDQSFKSAVKNVRTIERKIQRLGLIRVRRGKLKQVEKRDGVFIFA